MSLDHLSRRHFLATGAVASAGWATHVRAAAAEGLNL